MLLDTTGICWGYGVGISKDVLYRPDLPIPEWIYHMWYGCEGWVVGMMDYRLWSVLRSRWKRSPGGEG